MDEDVKLLRAYVAEYSEKAFADLVKRNLGLVYSVALRRVGRDSHLAEDVVQVVFSALARKAKLLTDRQTLSGWLYVSAHAASAEAVRKEHRRRRREGESVFMHEIQRPGKAAPEWDRIRPLLEGLIVRLERVDREAIVLRFFEKRSFADIGAALQLTEDSARKRVQRGLEKLRSTLAKAGFTSSAAALSDALAAEWVPSPPGGLAAKVASTAVSEFAAAAGGTSLAISFLSAINSGLVALVGIGLGLGALLTWQHRGIEGLRSQIALWEKQDSEVRSLHEENLGLARTLAQAPNAHPSRKNATAQGLPVKPPGGSSIAPEKEPFPVSVVWVSPEGTIRWNGYPVTLAEFLEQLKAYRARDPDPEGNIVIVGQKGAPFSAYAYAVDQASRAGIKNLTLSTPPSPTPPDISWLSPSRPNFGASDTPPPSLPDSSLNN